jgi:hypothetical protein
MDHSQQKTVNFFLFATKTPPEAGFANQKPLTIKPYSMKGINLLFKTYFSK